MNTKHTTSIMIRLYFDLKLLHNSKYTNVQRMEQIYIKWAEVYIIC